MSNTDARSKYLVADQRQVELGSEVLCPEALTGGKNKIPVEEGVTGDDSLVSYQCHYDSHSPRHMFWMT
eukprot:scaffold14700_cov110-Skeletonema_dohrnii-CCMP3373.AAC.1